MSMIAEVISIDCMLTQYKPDIVVRVPTRKYSLLQLGKAALLIEEGAQATKRELNKTGVDSPHGVQSFNY